MMSALSVIQLVLMLLKGVSIAAGKNGLTPIVDAANNAIAELQKVHGSEVTKGQLDALLVEPQW